MIISNGIGNGHANHPFSVGDLIKQLPTNDKNQQGDVFLYQKILETLVENSPIGIYIVENGTYIYTNSSYMRLLGYEQDELIRVSVLDFVHPEDIQLVKQLLEEGRLGEKDEARLKLRKLKKDGGIIHTEIHSTTASICGRKVLFGSVTDITEQVSTHLEFLEKHEAYEALFREMEELAYHDPLTKLPNRKFFETRLEQLINYSKESGRRFAVLFLDFDRFKFVNDSLGHQMGDELLIMIAQRLKQILRKTDTISRFAGDEFTIIIPYAKKEEVIRTAERISNDMANSFDVSGQLVTLSVSIGIAFSQGGEENVFNLIHNADTAMCYTKKYKRNSYTIYSEELDQKASYKLAIERDLKQAIENDELELYYQPIIDLNTQKVIAAEALVRWHHPELGLISPNDFIAVAEESGQIIPIGTWVLKTACRQNKQWQDSGIPPFKVAVNISTKQLQHYDFVETVIKILKETALEPQWLELEVTESILLEDIEFIKESLLKLKEVAISLSIDDFGTGYTSLSYLRQYPFDKVKIDRSFIEDINRDLNGKRITSAIISLAHSLNMSVVAEGIENQSQLEYLSEERCDEGQGYFFSRPMPVDSLHLDLLEKE
ncbi:putative bifunctional diguanylate cyclase/phosphodiesterase [Peribacillus glennii]|uniref:putative bifunctional diguanylate cyclase/phosphodiesterase n=1 Tax=Peribacillus glennii TaxID=2303991 RepID=UPI001F368B67|nr:bifunctional diguanylate cyclase/phosphodiesterase [Peribacillus glennii]